MNRTGIAYDVHRFSKEAKRPLILGGIKIPHQYGLEGHSDADVLSHSIADALLGSLGLPDIGYYFPPNDNKYKNISSLKILEKCQELLIQHTAKINNIDTTLIAETPKILPHIAEMKKALSKTLKIETQQIGIKASTNEMLGFIGRKEGIAALATANIVINFKN